MSILTEESAKKIYIPYQSELMAHGKKFLRVKGLFWVATRSNFIGMWSQAGQIVTLECSGIWYAASPQEEWPTDPEDLEALQKDWDPVYGDRGQELVFIGQAYDEVKIRDLLNKCLLTEEEDLAGAPAWSKFNDPLPKWPLMEDMKVLEQQELKY